MPRSSGRLSLLEQLPNDDVAFQSKKIKFEDHELIRLVEKARGQITAKSKSWDDLLSKYAALDIFRSESDNVYFDMFDAYPSIFSDETLNKYDTNNPELKDKDAADNKKFNCEVNNDISKEQITTQAAAYLDRKIPAVSLLSTVEIAEQAKKATEQLVFINKQTHQLEQYIIREKARLMNQIIEPLPLLLKEYFTLKRQLTNKEL